MSSSAALVIPQPASSSLELFLCLLVFASLFTYLLATGGLAWALVSKSPTKTLIPGPSGIPILGLVFAFTSSLTHRTLARLATTFSAMPLMAFSVGTTRFVISSHPETAKEILNSPAFVDRPLKESAYELLFHRAMGFAPYGEYWRNLRKIAMTHMFSPKRISSLGRFREKMGLEMVDELVSCSMERNGVVEVKKLLQSASLKNVMTSMFGEDLGGDGYELEKLVSEGYELLGTFNWSDHFPIIGWFDFQGIRKRCRELVSRVEVFVKAIIHQHRIRRSEDTTVHGGAFVDVLLDLESEYRFNDVDMVSVLWEMVFRGTDTVAILLEWIMARMVLHPDIQAKAQAEIESVVRPGQPVSDADLPNLHYLHAIVKETLRVHPPGPLLSWARLAIHDTHVGGHMVPAGTTAMVNMWSITHNQQIWPEPETFNPDRFIDQEVSVLGTDLRLAPFGAGRRVCPGKAMGLTTVQLWLAQLLQNFKWVPVGSDLGMVDLSECLKMSLEMEKPLVCKAMPRV